MFLHYMTSVSKGLHVEKILGRNLKFLSWFPSKTFLYALGFKKKSLVYYTVMKQTVIKFIIEENKQHFSKTCFDSSSAIFSSNWYKVQSWILSV